MSLFSSTFAVPLVASILNPRSASFLAMKIMERLSFSFTLMNTFPFTGSIVPAAIWDFANASPNSLSMPITSPVDFISGPRMGSTPGNLLKGNTDSFTATWVMSTSFSIPSSLSFFPTITFDAIFAHGTPVALETNGTVREALGFTSSTYIVSFFIAYCTFINPMTLSSFAIL